MTVAKFGNPCENFKSMSYWRENRPRTDWLAQFILLVLTFMGMPALAQTSMKVEVLRSFGLVTNAPAYVPVGDLLKGSDGRLYGYTREDGTNAFGTVFRFDPATKAFEVLKTLAPLEGGDFFEQGQLRLGSLNEGTDGFLYGVTRAVSGSGANFLGSSMYFRLKPDGSEFTSLRRIENAEGIAVADGVLLASDGKLYGAIMAEGGIFRMNPDGSGYEAIPVPTNVRPSNHRLVEGSDGKLYGTTEQGLDLFRVNKDGSDYGTVAAPRGAGVGVIVRFFEGSDGKLYVLQRGAWNAEPTLLPRGDNMDILFQGSRVYRVDKDGSNLTVLFQFSSQPTLPNIARGMTLGSDAKLYITCESTNAPDARGAVFRINQDGSGFELLHTFKAETGDGRDVAGGVTEGADGRLYGLVEAGLGSGAGGIYGVDKDGSDYAVEHQCIAMVRREWTGSGFTHSGDAAYPVGGLTDGGDGYLYGTSMRGGVYPRLSQDAWSGGTVFKLRKDGSGYQILHSFQAGGLKAPLLLGSDGWFYGVTPAYGDASNANGFVFRIGRTVGSYEQLYTFDGSSGKNPMGQLLEGPDGKLYGLASQGGTYSGGVAYLLAKDGSDFQIIHAFQQSEGSWFEHGLRLQSDGKLYGAAFEGGTNGKGTVFKMNPAGSDFAVILQTDMLEATVSHQNAISPPVLMPDGKLYGLTWLSSFYRMNPDGSGFETVAGLEQNYPESDLHVGQDGHFYFIADSGVFRFDHANRSIEQLVSLPGSIINGNTSGNIVFSSPDEIFIVQTQGPAWDALGDGNLLGTPGLMAFFAQGGVLKLTPGTDYGDAPSAGQSGFSQSYPVTVAENGARHKTRGPLLGSRRDAEKDGAHSGEAKGDDPTGDFPDVNIGVAREGVVLGVLRHGNQKVISVQVAGAQGRLDAWIDFNRDGDWDDAGEQVYQSLPLVAGANWLMLPVPVTASLGKTYARFRLSTAGGLTPRGLAEDGEVEDYEVTILEAESTGSNDDFANARSLSSARVVLSGSTKGAGLEAGEPLASGFASASRSVWYRWTARGNGEFKLRVEPADVVVAIWQGSDLNTLSQVAAGRTSVTVNEGVAGTDYLIQVTDTAAAGTDFTMSIEGAPAVNEAYFRSLATTVPGVLGFEMRGGGTVPYALEYTENWLTWTLLKTGTLTNGVLTLEDPEATSEKRFYRLKLLSSP